MKYFLALFFAGVFFLSACKDESSDEPQAIPVTTEESIEKLDTVFSAKSVELLNQLAFSKYARTQSAPVDWTTFRMVTSSHDDSMLLSQFVSDTAFYKKYGKLLKYSPDSSMFIDLDSYNIDFHHNSQGQLSPIEKGPDTEISLVELADNERTRLLFLGPGNSVEEATWINNEDLLLIGYHASDTTNQRTPVIWRYHIPTKTFYIYESDDKTIGGQLVNWRKERFRQISSSPKTLI